MAAELAVGLQTFPYLPWDPGRRKFRGRFLQRSQASLAWGMLPVPLLCRRLRWKKQPGGCDF